MAIRNAFSHHTSRVQSSAAVTDWIVLFIFALVLVMLIMGWKALHASCFQRGQVRIRPFQLLGIVNNHEKAFCLHHVAWFANALASAALLWCAGWLSWIKPYARYFWILDFYDICAAVEEISRLNHLPQEAVEHDFTFRPCPRIQESGVQET